MQDTEKASQYTGRLGAYELASLTISTSDFDSCLCKWDLNFAWLLRTLGERVSYTTSWQIHRHHGRDIDSTKLETNH